MELLTNQAAPRYGAQLALLFSVFGLGFIITSFLSSLLAGQVLHVPLNQFADTLSLPANLWLSRGVQVLYSILVFALPTIIVYAVFYYRPAYQIGFTKKGTYLQVLLMLGIVVCAYFAVGFFVQLMNWIPISTPLKKQFDQAEQDYLSQVSKISSIHSVADYLVSLVVLALVPACCEELLMRAGFQKILVGLTRKLWPALLISGLLFTLLHFSYYNFLSRLFLSIVLGLLYHYGKSIWFNIAAHFLNNAYVVTIMYIAAINHQDFTKYNDTPPTWASAALLLPLTTLFWLYIKQNKKTPATPHYE